MKVVAKPIEVVAWFPKDTKYPAPLRFRVEENRELQVIKISKVVKNEEEKLCGNKMIVYTCQAVINKRMTLLELKYDIEKMKWILWKI